MLNSDSKQTISLRVFCFLLPFPTHLAQTLMWVAKFPLSSDGQLGWWKGQGGISLASDTLSSFSVHLSPHSRLPLAPAQLVTTCAGMDPPASGGGSVAVLDATLGC